MSGAEAFLSRVVGALERAGVPYMLAGSFASSHHGAPRATQDIDIVVDPTFESLDRFLEVLQGDDVYFDADVARDEFVRCVASRRNSHSMDASSGSVVLEA